MTDVLPVEAVLDELRTALAEPGAAVLVAEPGAGKTTVVPLRLLGEPWAADGRLVVLEPRRLAARAAARRMAATLGEPVGQTVGYTTRDDRRTSASTRIEVVTEGILTRRLQHDPELPGVAAVVFDEFHERNLQSDLGLALALDVRRSLRPDLRMLVMSATIDAEGIAGLLDPHAPVPVVRSEGRQHPVTIRWRPNPTPGDRSRRELAAQVTGAVRVALRETAGDVLVFLPGMGELRAAADALVQRGGDGVEVHLLHGSLPADRQDAAIAPAPPGRRKVVFSTDIAETSLTVEGVTAVVDAGLARQPRFDPRTGMSRLVTVAAAKSSAEQRAGRAGRTEPGVAYRLWSTADHAGRDEHVQPEITRVDLAGLLLEVMAWGAEVSELALPDPPPVAALGEAGALLESLGATREGHLTELGRTMADLPLHPRLAALVVAGIEARTVETAVTLAAVLEERDVLRGHPDEVPADLALRVRLVTGAGRHHLVDPRALDAVRRRSRQLRRLVGRGPGSTKAPGDDHVVGSLLAAAYPDRVAKRREGQRGRFLLTSGTGAQLPEHDDLAAASALVVADVEGGSGDARIRRAAPVDLDRIEEIFLDQVTEQTTVDWDDERHDVVERRVRRLGAVELTVHSTRPGPGPAVVRVLTERVRDLGLDELGPSDRARHLQARIEFLHRTVGEDWPDVSDDALMASLDQWLPPLLTGARGHGALGAIDLAGVIRTRLSPHHFAAVDELAPERLSTPAGRRVAIDYRSEHPTVSVRVQDVFGLDHTPTVAGGRVPIVLELLSPAGRPVQITRDLAGFWTGSWHEVRKSMAGRYPKHPWPEDPVTWER